VTKPSPPIAPSPPVTPSPPVASSPSVASSKPAMSIIKSPDMILKEKIHSGKVILTEEDFESLTQVREIEKFKIGDIAYCHLGQYKFKINNIYEYNTRISQYILTGYTDDGKF